MNSTAIKLVASLVPLVLLSSTLFGGCVVEDGQRGSDDDSGSGAGGTSVGGAGGGTSSGGSGGEGPDFDPPRPIAPLSTAFVTTAQPTLRWELPAGIDGALVEICRDRAMMTSCQSIEQSGTEATPASVLEPGSWFWRLTGRSGTEAGSRTSPIWLLHVGVQPPGERVATSYGTSVDVNLDGYPDVILPAPNFDAKGRVQIYFGSATGLADSASVTILPTAGSDLWPWSVGNAGDVNGDGYTDVIIGAADEANGVGRVYVYFGGPNGTTTQPDEMVTGPAQALEFGTAVAGVNDVNGDGYGDVVIGERDGAHVFQGSASGIAQTPTTTLFDSLQNPSFGGGVAGAGDVNGDGYADVMVRSELPPQCLGCYADFFVHVYVGTPVGINPSEARIINDIIPDGGFGDSMGCAGDVNGDGRSDIIIGESRAYGQAGQGKGRAHLFYGRLEGVAYVPDVTITRPTGWQIGDSVASAHDVNHDGYDDVLLLEYYATRTFGSVYLGGASATYTSPLTSLDIQGAQWDGNIYALQVSVGSAGDANGDGDGDAFVSFVANPSGTMLRQVSLFLSSDWSTPATTLYAPPNTLMFGDKIIAGGP